MGGWKESEQFKDELNQKFAPTVVDYINKRRRLLGEIDHEAALQSSRQNTLAKAIMGISPAASYASAAADLRTGDAHYAAWIDAATRHESDLSAALFENPQTVIVKMAAAAPGRICEPRLRRPISQHLYHRAKMPPPR